MRSFIGAVPLSAVFAVVAVVVALALGPAVAQRLHARRSVGMLLLFGFGLVLAATLSPDAAALAGQPSDGTCDLSRLGFAPLHELTSVTLSSLNVLLFLPLGIAVGLLPRGRPAVAIALAAVALTFIVETIQLLVLPLGRGCQSADIFDNLLGLAIGVGMGILARPVLAWVGHVADRT